MALQHIINQNCLCWWPQTPERSVFQCHYFLQKETGWPSQGPAVELSIYTTAALKISSQILSLEEKPVKREWHTYMQPGEHRGIHVLCSEVQQHSVFTSFQFILLPCPTLSLIPWHTLPTPPMPACAPYISPFLYSSISKPQPLSSAS